MPEICAEKHKQIDRQFGTDNLRLNNHSDRLDKLEQRNVATEKDTGYLREIIISLQSTVKDLTNIVDMLKDKLGEKWEKVSMYILLTFLGSIIGIVVTVTVGKLI